MTILTDTKVRAKDRRDWAEPTLYLQRFSEAMTLLCNGNQPSEELLQAWLDDESEALQDFAATYGPSWAQGIGLIDAARLMADQPTEGPEHEHYAEPDTSILWPEPDVVQYESSEGEWKSFMDERHKVNTIESGEWPLRNLYTEQSVRTMLAPAAAKTSEQEIAAGVTSVYIDFTHLGTAGPFAVVDGRVTLPEVTMKDLVAMLRPWAQVWVWPEPIGARTRYRDSKTAEWSMRSVNHARALVGGAYEVDYLYSGVAIQSMLEAK